MKCVLVLFCLKNYHKVIVVLISNRECSSGAVFGSEFFLGWSLKNFNNNNKLEYIHVSKKKNANTSSLKFLFCEFLYFKIVV